MTGKEEENKDTPIMNFSGVLGFEIVQEDTEEDGPVYKIFRGAGKKRRLWAFFVNDKPNAINATYMAYAEVLSRVLKDAQSKIQDPAKAAELAEEKTNSGPKALAADPTPLFANPGNIVK